jgi:hypothetical protein
VWAGDVAGACVLDGGGAAGGWTRPAPGPPLPAARAARRSQSHAIGRPKGSICTCPAGPARTSPPPSLSRHAGRGREPAGLPARPITAQWEPADTQTGDKGAAGSPGSRGGSSDNPRDPSPTPRTGASPSPVTPRARAAAGLRPAGQPAPSRIASPHGPGQIAAAAAGPSSAAARITGAAGPEAAPAAAGCLPGSLMACPAAGTGLARSRGKSTPGGPVDGAGSRAAGRRGVPWVQAPPAAAG